MPKLPIEKAKIQIERDMCLLPGANLLEKYGKRNTPAFTLFYEIIGKTAAEIAPTHNPFFYYAMSVWFDKPLGRSLIYLPRHRDEIADKLYRLARGEYDHKDGLHGEYPRRALKSTFLTAFADWAPKYHKYMDDLDVLILYTHNSERAAQRRMAAVKNKNRHHPFIKKHFSEPGKCFKIPDGEWDTKEEWNWPCREIDTSVVEFSITAKGANSKKAGAGYHYKLIDDWEDEDSKKSKIIRDQLEDNYDQLRQLDAVPFCREASIGTPYHLKGLQTKMLEMKHEDGSSRYETFYCPALTDDNKPNFPTIPKLSVKSLAKERANIMERTGTDAFWYLQYQLDRRLTGFQSMHWEWFQELNDAEFMSKWNHIPHFTCVYGDSAWKGEDNQQEGDWTELMVIAHFIQGQLHQRVILDGWGSNEASSDEGAEEYCRLMKKWNTFYYQLEQQGEKYFGGVMKPVQQRHRINPVYIDIKGYGKLKKSKRISVVAGAARMGNIYYLSSCKNKPFLRRGEEQVDNHPQNNQDDWLDCLGNSFAEVIVNQWIPVGVPDYQMEAMTQEEPFVSATRYTGIPAVVH